MECLSPACCCSRSTFSGGLLFLQTTGTTETEMASSRSCCCLIIWLISSGGLLLSQSHFVCWLGSGLPSVAFTFSIGLTFFTPNESAGRAVTDCDYRGVDHGGDDAGAASRRLRRRPFPARFHARRRTPESPPGRGPRQPPAYRGVFFSILLHAEQGT